MSAEHKRPLYAFVVVAILCGLIVGHTMRTDALPIFLGRMAPMIAAQTGVFPGADGSSGDAHAILAVGRSLSLGDGTTGSDEAVLTERGGAPAAPGGEHARQAAGRDRVKGQARGDGARARAPRATPHPTTTPPGRFAGHTKGKARGLATGHHRQHQRAVPQASTTRAGEQHRVHSKGYASGHGKASGVGHGKACGHGKARDLFRGNARGHGKARGLSRGKARGHRR